MHAITSPTPDPPISLTPLPHLPDHGGSRWTVWRPWIVALVLGFGFGYLLAPEPSPKIAETVPSIETTLGWMFDAALGHTAVDESGAPVPPALTSPHIESVTIVDAVIGPLSVVVSDTVGSYVYDVRVERDQSDWVVRASRVDG